MVLGLLRKDASVLWAQDMKDGKGRLICDGIGTLAEADSTLVDGLTNKRSRFKSMPGVMITMTKTSTVQIWLNFMPKISPANASIKSRYFFHFFPFRRL